MLNGPGSRWPMLMLLLLVTGVGSAQQQPPMSTPPPAAAPAVLPEALAALEKMGGFLRTLKAYTLRADTSTDEVLADSGQKIQFNSVVEYRVRRPDRLRADVVSDRKHQQFFYDDKTLTLYGQRVHYYASIPAPPTIRETLIVAAQKYGLEMPLADLGGSAATAVQCRADLELDAAPGRRPVHLCAPGGGPPHRHAGDGVATPAQKLKRSVCMSTAIVRKGTALTLVLREPAGAMAGVGIVEGAVFGLCPAVAAGALPAVCGGTARSISPATRPGGGKRGPGAGGDRADRDLDPGGGRLA